MPDNQKKVIFTPKIEEKGRIDELPINPDDIAMPKIVDKALDETIGSEKMVVYPDVNPTVEELEAAKIELEETLKELEAEDLNKKNYLKVNPTFYVKSIKSENNDEELYKILNPETGDVETRELTDEEKKEVYILELKKSRIKFHSVTQDGNITTNKYGAKYKANRKRKNKATKLSRRKNRK